MRLPKSKDKKDYMARRHALQSPVHLIDNDYGLYIENCFNEMLNMERKRAERSKRPFLLMLLDIMKILRDDGKTEIARKITNIISSATRETDIKGWFKYDYVIGIIFTEINGVDVNSIKQKVVNNMCAVLNEEEINKIDITCHIFPEENDCQDQGKSPNLNLYPGVSRKNPSKKFSSLVKRFMDVIVSFVALIIFSPLFLFIPILIKLSSKGPILFKQERVGQFGKKFIFLKFRSMHENCENSIHEDYIKKFICEQKSASAPGKENEKGIYKLTNDTRITPIGLFLRKSSIDELPQLINVLRGEMSLVGPRPPIPYELENYDIWHMRRISEVKPGITGLWQVKGRSITTFDEMVRLDIRYIREWSLWLDIKIILKTPWAILSCKGAY